MDQNHTDTNLAEFPEIPTSSGTSSVKRVAKWLFILFIAILALAATFFFVTLNSRAGTSSKNVAFTVVPGQGLKVVSANLKENGLITNSFIFEVYEYLTGGSKKIEAGIYDLSSNMTLRQVASVFKSGARTEIQVKRIKEGATLQDIADSFYGTQDSSEKQAFLSALQAKAKTYDYLGGTPKVKTLEGYMFPDTYYFAKDATPNQVIDKILANTNAKITPEIRNEIQAQGRNINDVIILASIVEKEVGRNTSTLSAADLSTLQNEREIVAGIFMNRLKQGMLLQSDATVTYITKKRNPSASAADIQIDSPYNTYKYAGLPPGPISNPSLSSILAAVNYRNTDYLYFLTKKDGTAVFAKTLQEQEQNKQKYLGK